MSRDPVFSKADAEVRRPPVRKWGWIRPRMVALREIPVEVGSAELMRAVRLFQPYRDGPARGGGPRSPGAYAYDGGSAMRTAAMGGA